MKIMHRTVVTFMRKSVRVELSSMLRLSWLRSLSWASCSWSSEHRKASGRGSSSASRPSSSLRTCSISCSSSPRTAWTSRSAWASRAQYSSASARVFPTCTATVDQGKNWWFFMDVNSVRGNIIYCTITISVPLVAQPAPHTWIL